MISFLASPKSFNGPAGPNQLYAIQSWLAVHPDAEVLLYGDSDGTAQACESLGAKHVPDVDCSPSGLPYFNAIVGHAARHARHEHQIYLNCDIILDRAVPAALARVSLPRFLISGQRIDLTAEATQRYQTDPSARDLVELHRRGDAALMPTCSMDYFIFPRGMWHDLKPLIIGRGGYDNALIAYCLRGHIPIVDATYAIPALHQFHDYGHAKGGRQGVMAGSDAIENRRVHDIMHASPNIADSNWQLRSGELVPVRARGDLLRYFETRLRFNMGITLAGLGLRAVWRVLNAVGLIRPREVALADLLREPDYLSYQQTPRPETSCAGEQ